MSKLRPNVSANTTNNPVLRGGTAYCAILNAVQEEKDGLIHGKLHANGMHCAIGSLWERLPKVALPNDLIDEVAAINDSMPKATPKQRRLRMMKWLRWKVKKEGM